MLPFVGFICSIYSLLYICIEHCYYRDDDCSWEFGWALVASIVLQVQSALTQFILLNMEAKNFGYLLKNIPIPPKSKYTKCMVEKVESFVGRLRWKAYHFCKENRENDSDHFKNFALKTLITSSKNENMNAFENNMYYMIRNIWVYRVLYRLNKDIESIRSSRNVLLFADKSTNLLVLSCSNNQKLLHGNITQAYKKASKFTMIICCAKVVYKTWCPMKLISTSRSFKY